MILGIDPGLANLGWAVMDGENLIDYGCIETKSGLKSEVRLKFIFKEVKNIIEKHQIGEVVMESLYFAKNAKSALKVAEVMGVIKICAGNNGVGVKEYTPLQIKTSLVGYGRAEKFQVEEMVGRLLNLKKKISPSHASDAVAVAMTHLRYNGI